jgi:hypothetical protein
MDHPNIIIQLDDKSTLDFDFPGNLYMSSLRGTPRFYGLNRAQMMQLTGTTVELEGERIKWAVPTRYRTWELRSEKINFPYSDAITYYEKHGKFNFIDGIFHCICILISIFVYRFEKRK